jgi:hypothetical protein
MSEKIENKLVEIVIFRKSLNDMPIAPLSGIFAFDVKVDVRVQAENKLVMPFVEVAIRDGEKSDHLADFRIACIFVIPEFETKILLNEKNVYVIPPELEKRIKPIAISTARGIIYSELRGTYISTAIMPDMSL